tara:strand:+ start:7346 stop:7921 length:576 start_codon:yes stop_codon:yes gene_type:complete
MGDIYISSHCSHCKDLLIGIQKYDFLSSQFKIINVDLGQYPDYIQLVPSLVLNGQLITGQSIFKYFSELVDSYHQQNSQTQEIKVEQKNDIMGTYEPKKNIVNGEEIIEYDGWCSNGNCLDYSMITENNDDFTKGMHEFTTSTSFLDGSNEISSNETRVPLNKDDTYNKSDKQKQFDSDYEQMMSIRNSIK